MTDQTRTYSLAQRPDLASAYVSLEVPWPEFIEPSGLLVDWGIHAHREHQFVTLHGNEPVGRSAALPISWDGDPDSLPSRGWDGVVEQSATDSYSDVPLNTLCALEVGIAAGHHEQGLSSIILRSLRDHARGAGFDRFIVPVRPAGKMRYPHTPIGDYVNRRRDDGLPVDNWLRVHERIGGRVIGLCPTAMTISASLRTWETWTGHRFSQTGLTTVAGGIAPVFVNLELDYAVYVEPNVWVEHSLSNTPE